MVGLARSAGGASALIVAAMFLACGRIGGDYGADGDLPLPNRPSAPDDAAAEAAAPADASPPPPEPDAGPTPCGDAGAECERIVFVTSTSFTGNGIGGFAGADTKCQERADTSTHAAVRGHRFHAWISTTQSAVKNRLVHGTASYRKPSGIVVATGWTDLVDGTLLSGIDEDESGRPATGRTWTGTTPLGENGPDQCDAWTPSGNSGRAGIVGEVGPGWTNKTDDGCQSTHRLYCFQE